MSIILGKLWASPHPGDHPHPCCEARPNRWMLSSSESSLTHQQRAWLLCPLLSIRPQWERRWVVSSTPFVQWRWSTILLLAVVTKLSLRMSSRAWRKLEWILQSSPSQAHTSIVGPFAQEGQHPFCPSHSQGRVLWSFFCKQLRFLWEFIQVSWNHFGNRLLGYFVSILSYIMLYILQ